jgi:hypothetical protein
LKTVAHHVAIGAGSAIALKPVQAAVEKVEQAARNGKALFSTAILAGHQLGHIILGLALLCGGDGACPDGHSHQAYQP